MIDEIARSTANKGTSMNPQSQTAMPSYTLNCRMNQEAAALERLCQVVRVRGFGFRACLWRPPKTIWTSP